MLLFKGVHLSVIGEKSALFTGKLPLGGLPSNGVVRITENIMITTINIKLKHKCCTINKNFKYKCSSSGRLTIWS